MVRDVCICPSFCSALIETIMQSEGLSQSYTFWITWKKCWKSHCFWVSLLLASSNWGYWHWACLLHSLWNNQPSSTIILQCLACLHPPLSRPLGENKKLTEKVYMAYFFSYQRSSILLLWDLTNEDIFFFYIYLFYFILFFNFTILYWFCHISTCTCHRYTRVPHPEPSSLLPPRTIPLGRTSAPAPSIQYPASNQHIFLSPGPSVLPGLSQAPSVCPFHPAS